MHRSLTCLALVAGAILSRPALAAESYDNCAGFITSLPATIATPGIWCLDRDLTTNIASGNAITVNANNVTIECNRFRIGGLQAGPATTASGIRASNRLNMTIRNCNIRGFLAAVNTNGGGGHFIEGSRFDGNTAYGLVVSSAGSTIRNNQIIDTGGSTSVTGFAVAIEATAGVDVIDNTVSGVEALDANSSAQGIAAAANSDGSVIGNRIRGVVPKGSGMGDAIVANAGSAGMAISDNKIRGPGVGVGIRCSNNRVTARDNIISGYPVGISNCLSASNTVNTN